MFQTLSKVARKVISATTRNQQKSQYQIQKALINQIQYPQDQGYQLIQKAESAGTNYFRNLGRIYGSPSNQARVFAIAQKIGEIYNSVGKQLKSINFGFRVLESRLITDTNKFHHTLGQFLFIADELQTNNMFMFTTKQFKQSHQQFFIDVRRTAIAIVSARAVLIDFGKSVVDSLVKQTIDQGVPISPVVFVYAAAYYFVKNGLYRNIKNESVNYPFLSQSNIIYDVNINEKQAKMRGMADMMPGMRDSYNQIPLNTVSSPYNFGVKYSPNPDQKKISQKYIDLISKSQQIVSLSKKVTDQRKALQLKVQQQIKYLQEQIQISSDQAKIKSAASIQKQLQSKKQQQLLQRQRKIQQIKKIAANVAEVSKKSQQIQSKMGKTAVQAKNQEKHTQVFTSFTYLVQVAKSFAQFKGSALQFIQKLPNTVRVQLHLTEYATMVQFIELLNQIALSFANNVQRVKPLMPGQANKYNQKSLAELQKAIGDDCNRISLKIQQYGNAASQPIKDFSQQSQKLAVLNSQGSQRKTFINMSLKLQDDGKNQFTKQEQSMYNKQRNGLNQDKKLIKKNKKKNKEIKSGSMKQSKLNNRPQKMVIEIDDDVKEQEDQKLQQNFQSQPYNYNQQPKFNGDQSDLDFGSNTDKGLYFTQNIEMNALHSMLAFQSQYIIDSVSQGISYYAWQVDQLKVNLTNNKYLVSQFNPSIQLALSLQFQQLQGQANQIMQENTNVIQRVSYQLGVLYSGLQTIYNGLFEIANKISLIMWGLNQIMNQIKSIKNQVQAVHRVAQKGYFNTQLIINTLRSFPPFSNGGLSQMGQRIWDIYDLVASNQQSQTQWVANFVKELNQKKIKLDTNFRDLDEQFQGFANKVNQSKDIIKNLPLINERQFENIKSINTIYESIKGMPGMSVQANESISKTNLSLKQIIQNSKQSQVNTDLLAKNTVTLKNTATRLLEDQKKIDQLIKQLQKDPKKKSDSLKQLMEIIKGLAKSQLSIIPMNGYTTLQSSISEIGDKINKFISFKQNNPDGGGGGGGGDSSQLKKQNDLLKSALQELYRIFLETMQRQSRFFSLNLKRLMLGNADTNTVNRLVEQAIQAYNKYAILATKNIWESGNLKQFPDVRNKVINDREIVAQDSQQNVMNKAWDWWRIQNQQKRIL